MLQSRSCLLRQIWTSSGVLISMTGQGMMMEYMSVIPAIRLPSDEQVNITIQAGVNLDAQTELMPDIKRANHAPTSMAVILGFLLSSILMELLGRKKAYMLLTVPGPIAVLLLYTGSSTVLGQILADVTYGGTFYLGAVVLGEFTSPGHRGMFLILKTAAFSLGSTIFHILTLYYRWKIIALVIIIMYVISFLIVCTWLDSPAWLLKKGKLDVSERNFYSLQGLSQDSKTEFREMLKVQAERASKAKSSFEILRVFTKRSFIRPLFIIFMGCVLLEVSGRHIIPLYASDIFAAINGKKFNIEYTLYINIAITVSAIFSAILIKVMRTRTLLFSTGAAALLVLLIGNTYLFLSSNKIISNDHQWVPTSLFGLYFILVNLGCIPVPLALIGEIFPLKHKSTGLFVTGLLSCLCLDATMKTFLSTIARLKIYCTFAITGMIMTLVLMILFIVLPETKNKTLQEIEDNIQYGLFATKSLSDIDERDRMLKV